MVKLMIATLIVAALVIVSGVKAGVACFAACAVACCEAGVFAFAGPLGIAVGYTGCAGVCMVACAAGSFVPPACFDKETMILTQGENYLPQEMSISSIKEKDVVLTLKDGKTAWTRVSRSIKSEGEFQFVQIVGQDLENGDQKQITLTEEHGVVQVDENEQLVINSAKNVVIGDKLVSISGGSLLVTRVTSLSLNEKYTLETVDGTVLASGFFMTTICSEELDGQKHPFSSKMKLWKNKHSNSGVLVDGY